MSQRHEILYYVRLVRRRKKSRVDLSGRVLAFSFEDNERKADKMVLTVDNWDLKNFDTPVWAKGNELEVSWGYVGNMAPPRQVTITKVTGSTTLKIEGVSKSFVMDRVPRSRTFEGVSRSDVVTQIAEEYGYGQDARDIDDTGDPLRTISQPSITDAAFLRRLANKEGFEFYVDFDGFHWHERRTGQKANRQYTWFTDNTGTIMSFQIENDITVRPGFVRVKGRDLLKKKDFSQDITPTAKLAAAPDVLGSIDQAKAAMRNPDSSKKERQAATIFILNEMTNPGRGARASEQVRQGRALAAAQQAARAEIQATSEAEEAAATKKATGKIRRRKQLSIKLKIKAIGDPSLLAKSVMRVSGIGERISGNYYVKAVKHNIGAGGYVCDIKLIRDGQNRISTRLFEKAQGGGAGGSGSCASYVAVELGIVKTLWATWKSEAATYTGADTHRSTIVSVLISTILREADRLAADPMNAEASQNIFIACKKLKGILKPGKTFNKIASLRMPAAKASSVCSLENSSNAKALDARTTAAVSIVGAGLRRKAVRVVDSRTGKIKFLFKDNRGRE